MQQLSAVDRKELMSQGVKQVKISSTIWPLTLGQGDLWFISWARRNLTTCWGNSVAISLVGSLRDVDVLCTFLADPTKIAELCFLEH